MTTKKAKERARMTTQMLNENKKKQDSGTREEFYDIPSGWKALLEQDRQEELERQRMRYRFMHPVGCNFERVHRTPADKEYFQQWWNRELPAICKWLRSTPSYLRTELDWVKKCHRTFGSAEVYYEGPGPGKSGKSGNRRNRMKRRCERFKRVQLRRALYMLKAGKNILGLVAMLDNLIERYDNELVAQGLHPSDLRDHLRVCNMSRVWDQQKQTEKGVVRKNADLITKAIVEDDSHAIENEPQVMPLDISPSDLNTFFKELQQRVNTELLNDADDLSEMRMEGEARLEAIEAITDMDMDMLNDADDLSEVRMEGEARLEAIEAIPDMDMDNGIGDSGQLPRAEKEPEPPDIEELLMRKKGGR